ncbi:hypothetical protein V3C99_002529 [Haemonchus contortus]
MVPLSGCSSIAAFVHDKSEKSSEIKRTRAKKIGKARLKVARINTSSQFRKGPIQRVVFYRKIIVTMEITPHVPNQPWFPGSGDNTTRMD